MNDIFVYLSVMCSELYFDLFCSIEAASAAHPTADVFINFASFRRSVHYYYCFDPIASFCRTVPEYCRHI
jgi:hypothetical protein